MSRCSLKQEYFDLKEGCLVTLLGDSPVGVRILILQSPQSLCLPGIPRSSIYEDGEYRGWFGGRDGHGAFRLAQDLFIESHANYVIPCNLYCPGVGTLEGVGGVATPRVLRDGVLDRCLIQILLQGLGDILGEPLSAFFILRVGIHINLSRLLV